MISPSGVRHGPKASLSQIPEISSFKGISGRPGGSGSSRPYGIRESGSGQHGSVWNACSNTEFFGDEYGATGTDVTLRTRSHLMFMTSLFAWKAFADAVGDGDSVCVDRF